MEIVEPSTQNQKLEIASSTIEEFQARRIQDLTGPEHGWSQEKVAEALGIDLDTVSSIVNGSKQRR